MDVDFVAGFAAIAPDPAAAASFYRGTLGLPLEPVMGDYLAVAELVAAGHQLVHDTKTEPWGQTIVRLLGPEGLLVGIYFTPDLHVTG